MRRKRRRGNNRPLEERVIAQEIELWECVSRLGFQEWVSYDRVVKDVSWILIKFQQSFGGDADEPEWHIYCRDVQRDVLFRKEQKLGKETIYTYPPWYLHLSYYRRAAHTAAARLAWLQAELQRQEQMHAQAPTN